MGMGFRRQILFTEDFKMHRSVLQVFKSVIFLTILIGSLGLINQILMPKYIMKNSTWPTTSSYHQFYEMEKDSVDVLFFGSSVAVNAFSPQEIYNQYGIRSYNLGSEQQSIFLSYFWLKEALRSQTPQVVILDTRFLFELHPENPINTIESLTRKCLDPMKWSSVKCEAVSDLCRIDETQSELSYYFTNIRFHTRWTGLTEYDMVREEVQYSELKGFGPIETYGPESYNTYTPSGDTKVRTDTHEVMQVYLDKTVELCRDKGIALVLVSLPGNRMQDGIHNTLTAYAEEKGIDYYNLCESENYQAIGAVLPRESVFDHENIWGARKMSDYIGNMLQNVYQVAAVQDEQYEHTKAFYEHIIQNCELPHITDINEYLQAIRDERYTVFIAVRDEASAGLTDPVKENLMALGLSEDLTGKYRWSYSAVISPEHGVTEMLTENEPARLSGSIRDRKTYYMVTSCGSLAGTSSSINIDGTEYCKNARGLNFVIYDNDLMKVVDRVAFDTCNTCGAVR